MQNHYGALQVEVGRYLVSRFPASLLGTKSTVLGSMCGTYLGN